MDKLNPVLEGIYRTGLVEDAQGQKQSHFPASIRQGVGAAIYDLIRRERLTRTLEVGTAWGLSTLFFCQAHHDAGAGQHTAIDPFQTSHYRGIGVLNTQRAGFAQRLRFIEEPSHLVLPRLLTAGEQFDFAFIDGARLYDFVQIDFFYLDLMLRTGGYLLFDDIWMHAVRKVISFAQRNRNYRPVRFDTLENVPWHIRLGRVARKFLAHPFERHTLPLRLTTQGVWLVQKTGPDERPWDFHRSF